MQSRKDGEAKQRIRDAVWRRMTEAGVVRFPYGSGRIPNFAAADRAAERLAGSAVWKKARVLKCNPDYAQMPVRRRALLEGKLIYMAAPRLRGPKPFIEIDPAMVRGKAAEASTIAGAERLGRKVSPEEMRQVEAVVCGSVAVRRDGARLGKGGGFSDLEFALLRTLGLLEAATPVLTTVHALQVVEESIPMLSHDLAVTHFATPEGVIECDKRFGQPAGITPELLNDEQREEIEVLKRLQRGQPG